MTVRVNRHTLGDRWNDRTSSVEVLDRRCTVTRSTDADHQGASMRVFPGLFDLEDLRQGGVGDDTISSARVSEDGHVRRVPHAGWQGGYTTPTRDSPRVEDDWNDVFSSILVF